MTVTRLSLTGTDGKVLGAVTCDETGGSWRIAAEAEPTFKQTFPTRQDAFYFWYSRFDPTNGHLRN
jgi:hypothetical protein